MLLQLRPLHDQLLRTRREIDSALLGERFIRRCDVRLIQRRNDAALRELERTSDRLEGRDKPLLILTETESRDGL